MRGRSLLQGAVLCRHPNKDPNLANYLFLFCFNGVIKLPFMCRASAPWVHGSLAFPAGGGGGGGGGM